MAKRLIEMVSLLLQTEGEWHSPEECADHELVRNWLATGCDPRQVELALQIADQLKDHFDMPAQSAFMNASSEGLLELLERVFLPVEVRGYLWRQLRMERISPAQYSEIIERLLLTDPCDLSLNEAEELMHEAWEGDPTGNPPRTVDPGAAYLH